MKTKSKITAGAIGMIALCMIGFLVFSAFTAPVENGKAEMVLDIRNYLDKNVKPVMEPQRVKLDKMLTAEEKAEVGKLNGQLRKLIKDRNDSGIGFIGSPEFSVSEIPVFTAKQKAQQKADRDEMRRIMTRAWAIADRHETEIAQLLDEKSGNFETWKKGMTSIIKDNLDSRFFFIGGKQIVKRLENSGIGRYNLPVAFLLWDPQQRFVTDDLIKK